MPAALLAAAWADSLEAYGNGALPDSVAINSLWVIVAALFVMFMQAGFAFLEIGFSRGRSAGTIVAEILTNRRATSSRGRRRSSAASPA